MKSFTCVLVLAVFSAHALAEGLSHGSEFQHQTAGSTFEVTPEIDYEDNTSNIANSQLSKFEVSGFAEVVRAEYGLNEIFSVGLILKIGTLNGTYTPGLITGKTQNGLYDPDLFLNGRSTFGIGSFRYGTHLTVSLGNATVDTGGNTNNYSGGTTITPFVGYEVGLGESTVGARIQYSVYQSSRTIATAQQDGRTVNSSETGGNLLTTAVFYEYEVSPFLIGADFNLNNITAQTLTTNNSVSNISPLSVYGIDLYASWEITPSITLLPKLSYLAYGAFDTSSVSSVNGYEASIAGRFAF